METPTEKYKEEETKLTITTCHPQRNVSFSQRIKGEKNGKRGKGENGKREKTATSAM